MSPNFHHGDTTTQREERREERLSSLFALPSSHFHFSPLSVPLNSFTPKTKNNHDEKTGGSIVPILVVHCIIALLRCYIYTPNT
jgi:hypothetical protein